MELYYTPRSHFSRKVRILLAAHNLHPTLTDVGNVAEANAAQFGNNPLMKVPALIHHGHCIMDSDHIATYLVHHVVGEDRYQVSTTNRDLLNLRVIMNGIMTAEVSYILAARTGIQVEGLPRFEKLKASMIQGLAWLETNHKRFPRNLNYVGFHLVSMWDHLELYDLLPLPYPNLKRLALHFSQHDFVTSSKPE